MSTNGQAKTAGGKLAAGPFEMGEVGGLRSSATRRGVRQRYQPAEEGAPAEGVFVWDELGTTDVEGAERFYGEVFGWTTKDMGPDFGGYKIFQVGETRIAGVMALQDASMPSMWAPYVAVEDVDGTVTKTSELGGSTLLEAMDVPTVGRFAYLRDPQGAVFGVIKPEPAA
jgi:predicted enzyme related to lactoylglutathione lyase